MRETIPAVLLMTTLAAQAAEAPSGRRIAAPPGKIPVAFVMSPGATMIDFAGPWEVFQDARSGDRYPFELFTVAESRTPIKTSGGMSVVPDHTFDDAPQPKVIVIPAQRGSPGLVAWLKKASQQADVTMSVCTGAFKLAQAGLLDGRKATTHHEFFDALAREHPKVDVQRGPRWVEGDRIATAGGLTSGIDLALRVVARYFGDAEAQRTAEYMEYTGSGWKTDAGIIDTTTAEEAAREAERRRAAAKPALALTGLDPVLLTEGKERKGNPELAVDRGRYRYAFESASTRDRFNANPAAFEIQLDGACAAMARSGAAPGSGDPDRFLVHDGKIYVFGSDGCRDGFKSQPASYVAK